MQAFVFGKFLPFHKGHEAMIRFALTKAQYLVVLVCASDKEKISGEVRKQWIEQTFANGEAIDIKVFPYSETELTNTSIPSDEVSRQWASVFKEIVPSASLLISSELYGDFVAMHMNIDHIMFDRARLQVPVSGTLIKENVSAHWDFLPNSVKRFFTRKIVLLGTESTGKTTFTKHLAQHYQATEVLEVGRELIPHSSSFTISDLQNVVVAHTNAIQNAEIGPSPIVIADTNIYITLSYAEYAFGQPLPFDEKTAQTNDAGLFLYLNSDAPYIQDGTRLSKQERDNLDFSHRKTLQQYSVTYTEITGTDWGKRYEQALQHINNYLMHEELRYVDFWK